MKIHLARTIGKGKRKISSLACVRDAFKKGKIVELREFMTIPKKDRCQKCDKIAEKGTDHG